MTNPPLRQSAIFYSGEGDAWYLRNKDADMNPKVIAAITAIEHRPQVVVEVGCGDGRYLNEMQKHYQCDCIGYDPSGLAIHDGRLLYPNLDLRLGTVRAFHGLQIDMLVFGFCLYLVDREDLFALVHDVDWSLRAGGYMIIHDFDPEYPQKVPYHHKEGIFTYKMDYPKLWLANPVYELVSKTITREGEAITIIRKGTWNKWHNP